MRASKKKRGLATLPPERRIEIATLGGHAGKPKLRDPFLAFRKGEDDEL